MALLLISTLASGQANAQKYNWEEAERRIKAATAIEAIDDADFGENIRLYDGSLGFSTVDVDVPGLGLPVSLGRRYTVENRKDYPTDGMMADWQLDVPSVSGIFMQNWESSSGVAGKRCSVGLVTAPPPAYPGAQMIFHADFWQGNQLNLPGREQGEMLIPNADVPRPSTGGPYYWISAAKTYFACLASIKNGGGEGFIATTADGTRYWFDWMAQHGEPNYIVYNAGQYPRKRNVLYATRVEDRFGNWVSYTYTNAWNASGRLTEVRGSDGRVLQLSYNASGHVSAIVAGARRWEYQYVDIERGRKSLSKVVLPDGSSWGIGFSAFSRLEVLYPRFNPRPGESERDCFSNPPPLNNNPASGTLSHPSGATVEYTVALRGHGRSNVPVFCLNYSSNNNDPNDDVNRWPFGYESYTLLSRRMTGAGLPPSEKLYSYTTSSTPRSIYYPGGNVNNPCPAGTDCGAAICTSDSCAGTKFTVVSGPGGQWSRYTFGNSYRYNEAKLLKVEVGRSASSILSTTTNTYDLSGSNAAYPARYGQSPRGPDDSFVSEYHRPLLRRVVVQQGMALTEEFSGFDFLSRPGVIKKFSSVQP